MAPANAGDTGLTPGLGRFHMPWDNWGLGFLGTINCDEVEV